MYTNLRFGGTRVAAEEDIDLATDLALLAQVLVAAAEQLRVRRRVAGMKEDKKGVGVSDDGMGG